MFTSRQKLSRDETMKIMKLPIFLMKNSVWDNLCNILTSIVIATNKQERRTEQREE